MALPPLYAVDGKIEVVLDGDLAWDREKIDGDDPEHAAERAAFSDYANGRTRFHLSDEVKALFRDGVRPTVFHMKRLGREHWERTQNIMGRGDNATARNYALRHSLKAITDGDENVPLKGPDNRKEPWLTLDDFDNLERLVGRSGVVELGMAAIIASGDLAVLEKKQSG